MKVWVLAGILSLAPLTQALASDIGDDAACQADAARQDARADSNAVQAAPPPAGERRAIAGPQREANAAPVRVDAARRRSGKAVPDAELIAPRGAL